MLKKWATSKSHQQKSTRKTSGFPLSGFVFLIQSHSTKIITSAFSIVLSHFELSPSQHNPLPPEAALLSDQASSDRWAARRPRADSSNDSACSVFVGGFLRLKPKNNEVS